MSSVFLPVAVPPVWRMSPGLWALLGVALLALIVFFGPALEFMVATWRQVEEYSYGWFIPVIAAFLVWQRSDELRLRELRGSWWGLPVLALALLLGVVGNLSAVRMFSQYGFVLAIVGIVLAAVGGRGTRLLGVALAILVFMVPLPQFLLRELSHVLQLVSSQLGVLLIRAAGISVFLEGNVIDLGSYKLQVVEACNGLRYLFPLMVLGCLAAYFHRGPAWHRVLLVASTVPLTVVINSLRIGLIGVTVEHWGVAMAEGLLHDLEGGFMFLLCMAGLALEMAVLTRLTGRPWREAFAVDVPEPAPRGVLRGTRPIGAPLWAAAGLALLAAAVTLTLPSRDHSPPARDGFASLPLELEGGWSGRPDTLAPDVIATLALSDYALVNYRRGAEPWVNFYSAYYATQSGGESAHSPRTCIPGDGWAIVEIGEHAPADTGGLRVNRAVIQKGEHRHLVYYWFRQRGANYTDEWRVKWSILRDGVLRERSDGALVRLITPIAAAEGPAVAEQRLNAFVRTLGPLLPAHIPD